MQTEEIMQTRHFTYIFVSTFHDLPLQQVQQLLHSKFVNTMGISGQNIPQDLHLEHLNRLCKDCVKGFGSNKTAENIVQSCNAMNFYEIPCPCIQHTE